MTTRVFAVIVKTSYGDYHFDVTGEDFGDATYNSIAIVSKKMNTLEVVKEINLKEIE